MSCGKRTRNDLKKNSHKEEEVRFWEIEKLFMFDLKVYLSYRSKLFIMTSATEQLEKQLVNRLKAGEEEAFTELYDNYSPMLYGIILRIVHYEEEAQNLLQDCFVKIWINIESFNEEKGRFATWLINIARNTAIDYRRSGHFTRKHRQYNLEQEIEKTEKMMIVAQNVDTVGLRQIVHRLPISCRKIIEWMYFEGYTQSEISKEFGIPLGTVKSRTRIALRELRNIYLKGRQTGN